MSVRADEDLPTRTARSGTVAPVARATCLPDARGRDGGARRQILAERRVLFAEGWAVRRRSRPSSVRWSIVCRAYSRGRGLPEVRDRRRPPRGPSR